MQIGLPTDVITLDGKLDGQQIHAKLHHIPEPSFLHSTAMMSS